MVKNISLLYQKSLEWKLNSFTRSYILIYGGKKDFLSSSTIIINEDMNVIVRLQIWTIAI
jgi:hypothetical protein